MLEDENLLKAREMDKYVDKEVRIYDEMKEWIDKATYEQLLRRWRFSLAGDPIFKDAIGMYYIEVMHQKGKEVGYEGCVEASKKVGWESNP